MGLGNATQAGTGESLLWLADNSGVSVPGYVTEGLERWLRIVVDNQQLPVFLCQILQPQRCQHAHPVPPLRIMGADDDR